MEQVRYVANASNFSKIPGSPLAYWVNIKILEVFDRCSSLDEISSVRQGIIPGNVDAFLRLWFEVSLNKIGFNHTDYSDIAKYHKKWFLYNKGGHFRKWYGNTEHLINMENNGYDIQHSGLNNNYRLREPKFYFKEAISWSKISSGLFSMRYTRSGCLFDIAGCSVFGLGNKFKYILALGNSKITSSIMEFISPTLNYEVDHVKKLPIRYNEKFSMEIDHIVNDCITISKTDWDSFETSWDFKKHPLI